MWVVSKHTSYNGQGYFLTFHSLYPFPFCPPFPLPLHQLSNMVKGAPRFKLLLYISFSWQDHWFFNTLIWRPLFVMKGYCYGYYIYYKRSSTPGPQPNTGTVSIARPRLEGDSVNGAAAGQRDDIISHCLHRCSTLSYRATKAALHRGAAATEQRMMSSLTTCPCYGTVPTTRVLAAS